MPRRLRITGVLQTRAAFQADSFNPEAGTVEVTWTTGSRGLRRSWEGPYYEELEVSAEAVNLARMNNGASVLNTHSQWDIRDVIGVVERAWIQGKEGRALIRFSDREEVKPVKRDVQAGILRHVSVGYSVQKYEQVEKVDEVPVYRATRWTPAELSLVPVAFDDGAVVRAGPEAEPYEVEVHSRSEEHGTMPDKIAAAATATEIPPAQLTLTDEAVRAAEARGAEAAIKIERERVTVIRGLVRQQKLGDEFADELVTKGVTLDQARTAILDKLAAKDDKVKTEQHLVITAGEDEREKFVRGACAWIFHRAMVADKIEQAQKLPRFARYFKDVSLDPGEFAHMRASDMARRALELRGEPTRGLYGEALIKRALIFNGTADFPVLLETAMRKTLIANYATQPTTWRRFCGVKPVQDFRTAYFYRNGSFGTLDTVNEHGEFKMKAVPDGEKTGISVSTKGNIIGLTRQALVNDDLGAFNDVAARWGQSAGRSIEVDVYALITLNTGLGPTQADGQPLFHANRANIGLTGAMTALTVSSMRQKMRAQKDPSGNDFLDLQPSVLLVPTGLEDTAKILNGDAYDPGQVGQKTNAARGMFTDIVSSPRLTASTTRHYSFADPGAAPALVVSFLEGEEAPQMVTEQGFEYDGVRWRVRIDYGVQVFDYKPAVTCAGV